MALWIHGEQNKNNSKNQSGQQNKMWVRRIEEAELPSIDHTCNMHDMDIDWKADFYKSHKLINFYADNTIFDFLQNW